MNNTMRTATAIAAAIIMILCITATTIGDDTEGVNELTPVELNSQKMEEILSGNQYLLDEGSAFVLAENIDLGNNYIKMSGNVSLDLAGHTITSSNNHPITVYTKNLTGTAVISDSVGGGSVTGTKYSAISNTGNLVITGGTFEGKSYAVYQPYNGVSLTISGGTFEGGKALKVEGGSLKVEGGTISGTDAGIHVSVPMRFLDDKYVNPVATIDNGTILGNFGIVVEGRSNSTLDATLTVNGGTITGSNGSAISGNGNKDNTHITVNDGVLTGNNNPGIYHPQSGDLTVNGGTITGEGGIQYCGSGSVEINGGTIRGTYAEVEYPEKPANQDDGAIIDGAALSIISRGSGYQDGEATINVTITGGTFISDNNSAINSYRFNKVGDDWQTGESTGLKSFVENVNITGGEFKSPVDKSPIEFDTKDESAYAVSGGSFSSAINEDLIATNSQLKETADGSYVTVGPNTADITGTNPAEAFVDDDGDMSITILSDGNYSNITVNLNFDELTISLIGYFDLGYTTISLMGYSTYSDITEMMRFSIVITNPSGEARFSHISINFPITPADFEGLNLGIYPISGGSLIDAGATSFDTNGLTYSGPYYSDFAVAVVDGSSSVNPPSWDEEELPPFIPTQDSDDDSVTIVACAAAAAVAAIMAVFLIIDRKR